MKYLETKDSFWFSIKDLLFSIVQVYYNHNYKRNVISQQEAL